MVPYTGVGILTQFVFSRLSLKHGHRFVDNDDTKNRQRSMVVIVAACIIIVMKCSLFIIFYPQCKVKRLYFFQPSVQQMCSYVRIKNKSMTLYLGGGGGYFYESVRERQNPGLTDCLRN